MTQEDNEQPQDSSELNKAANAEAPAVISVFDEQEVDYVVLDRCLSKLLVMMEKPWPGKEKLAAVKLNREHVEFIVRPLIGNQKPLV
jgi:hypothetical protein